MKGSRLLVAGMLFVAAAGPARSQDAPTDYSVGGTETPSLAGQAAEAVVGRVFGVEGDASEIKYHEIELTSHTPGAAATRSLLLPGWGQYFNRQRTKGTVFFLTAVGLALASAHVYGKANDSYDVYQATQDKDDSHYDDYVRDRNRSIFLGGAAAVIWIASIFDAYRNAYKPLYSQSSSLDVALLDEGGAQVRYHRSF